MSTLFKGYNMYKEAPQIEPQEDAHATLRAIYQCLDVPLRMRMQAAAMALPYERPKLEAVATFNGGEDFGTRLERAIASSNSVRQPLNKIEAKATTNGGHLGPSAEQVSANAMPKSFPSLRRRA
jgi:hypothetical protein